MEELRPTEPDEPGDTDRPTTAGKVVMGLVIGLPVLLFGGCGILLAVNGGESEPQPPTGHEAALACREWVENQLKAPSTAEFGDENISLIGNSEWDITGTVDAQNGFGAQIRTAWACDIRLDGNTWRGNATLIE